MKTGYEFPVYLECPNCSTRVDELEVEELGIEEDWRGADVVTYICPNCGKVVESHRLS